MDYDSDTDFLPTTPTVGTVGNVGTVIPRDIGGAPRVLFLRICKTWFDLAVSGARQEDARRVSNPYKRLGNGATWDLVKLVNGYARDAPVHMAFWKSTHVVPSYTVTAPNGTVYASPDPHYIVTFVNGPSSSSA